ncbi:MAG: hypothetical protein J3Q66DRAFT_390148 [Benniella sp.]|nr:MAG: hypothetical protein J3Q66DRAFT_390148 [Benniella sp.]
MFGITELDELVFPQLDRHELAQCMRVNKKWHEAAVRFLWNDLTCLEQLSWDQRQAFSTLVQEDYFQVQQQRKLKEEGQDMGQHTLPISNLAKYGRYVQLLAPMWDLIALLETHTMAQLSLVRQKKGPTCHELFLHLFDNCPAAQVSAMSYGYPRLPSDLSPAVIERVLPRVLDLKLHTYDDHTMKAETLMEILNRCSSALVSLRINVVFEGSKDEVSGQQEEMTASNGRMSLTHLELGRWGDHPGYTTLRRWLLRRCSCMQKIEVCRDSLISQRFVEDALTYMPNLKEVVLKGDGLEGHNNAAAILSASRHGWRFVTIEYWRLDDAGKMSLANHFSTLQMLDVSQCDSFTDDDLVKVLSSCPHLHTLNDHSGDGSCIHSNAFIDRDPTTGLLKAWACESSLRVLNIKVTGIPRPDLKTGGEEDRYIVEEAYNGQGRDIQELVYDRLARLTHLETIVMAVVFDPDVLSCPEFTLESGLHKLAGLKSLKRLDLWANPTPPFRGKPFMVGCLGHCSVIHRASGSPIFVSMPDTSNNFNFFSPEILSRPLSSDISRQLYAAIFRNFTRKSQRQYLQIGKSSESIVHLVLDISPLARISLIDCVLVQIRPWNIFDNDFEYLERRLAFPTLE